MKLIDAVRQRNKGTVLRWTHYLEAYDFHLSRLQPKKLLEIGVMGGGSLWMWKKYFPNTEIIGVDFDPRCKQWEGNGVSVFVGDQSDTVFLELVDNAMGPFDIIVDDGSHKMGDQKTTFGFMFPRMVNGGIYVIEDLHTSFWPTWDGGGEDSTLNMLKWQIDKLQGWALRSHERKHLKKDFIKGQMESDISSLHFYDSICFIYKNGHGQNLLGESGYETWATLLSK